jgi:hypothetical protein
VPTCGLTARFKKDFAALAADEKKAFRTAVRKFITDLDQPAFRAGLRVKGIQGAKGIYEMTWAPDGRATFEYGESEVEGQVRIIWRRCGKHSIFDSP